MKHIIKFVIMSLFIGLALLIVVPVKFAVLVGIALGALISLNNVKVDLFGAASTIQSWYVSLLNINPGIGTRNKRTYNLFFLSRDFIGWRLEIFFLSFNKGYDKRDR